MWGNDDEDEKEEPEENTGGDLGIDSEVHHLKNLHPFALPAELPPVWLHFQNHFPLWSPSFRRCFVVGIRHSQLGPLSDAM